MKDQDKKRLNILLGYIILIIVGTITSVTGIYIIQRTNHPQLPVVENTEKPSTYPDYDVIKGLNPDPKIKVIKFTSNCPELGCINDNPATRDFDGIKKNYSVKGNVSRGYLYIEAEVDYKRPLTNYDDFYFSLNYSGGHLLTGKDLLPIPPSDISRYLYDLRSISYTYKGKLYNKVNFLALLQNTTLFNIHVAVSSDRPGRVLKDVSIYYQCAENSDCLIKEISNK
jgi:hypothetical protein